MNGDLITGDARLQREDAASDHWFTPLALYFKLSEELGPFTLDVAGHPNAPVSQKIGRFFTSKENGLTQSWAGETVWCNPPYSEITPWVERTHHLMAALSPAERPRLVVQLLPAWTDRGWWADWVEQVRDAVPGALVTTRFLRRQTFGTPADPYAKASKSTASFSSVVLTWRHPFTVNPSQERTR